MKNFIKQNWSWIVILLWFALLGIVATTFVSCSEKPKIEKGDVVVKCIVDSVWVKQSPSTITIHPIHYVKTSCGETHIVNNSRFYHKGDTISYVYKKQK
jgi:hypothetical protein